MKAILSIILITTSFNAYSACTINAQVKKANAKTYYVDGVSISKKVRTALKSQCKFNVSVMSKADKLAMAELAYKRKLESIKAGK